MDELIYLLKLNQEELKLVLYDYLNFQKMNPIFEDGFLYATGNIPILVVAHMDTVFKMQPEQIIYDEANDKIYNRNGGLGGDDRCGVYAILKLLNTYRPYVLFTEDEEIGCIGALKALKKMQVPSVKYIIEFDRHGKNDCVFYACGNKKFMRYIESFGFKKATGTCSDIYILGSNWDIASVNLSCGYYNEHTISEYVIFSELQNAIKRAEIMLDNAQKSPYFNYQDIRFKLSINDRLMALLNMQDLYLKKGTSKTLMLERKMECKNK